MTRIKKKTKTVNSIGRMNSKVRDRNWRKRGGARFGPRKKQITNIIIVA